jgi:hypothetical protein
MTLTFDSVWYRHEPQGLRNYRILAMQDKGQLIVSDDSAEFVGRRARVQIANVLGISEGRQGIDIVNSWIRVDYGYGKVAYLKDGSRLGWGGAFGGNKKIVAALWHLRRQA